MAPWIGAKVPEAVRLKDPAGEPPIDKTTAAQDVFFANFVTGPLRLGSGTWDRTADWTTMAYLTGKNAYEGVDGVQEWLDFLLVESDFLAFAYALGLRVILPSTIRLPEGYLQPGERDLDYELSTTYDRYDRNAWTRLGLSVTHQHYLGPMWDAPTLGPAAYSDPFDRSLGECMDRIEAATGMRPWVTEYGAARSWIRPSRPGYGSERDRMRILAEVVRRTAARPEPTMPYNLWNRLKNDPAGYRESFDFGLVTDRFTGPNPDPWISIGASHIAAVNGASFPDDINAIPPGFTSNKWLYDAPRDDLVN